jgi:hypothetical protein
MTAVLPGADKFVIKSMKIIIAEHALFEAKRRKVTAELIKSVISNPQQKLPSKKGRVIVQNRYYDDIENKEMLLRIIGVESTEEFKVITVYKTSRIEKYWMKEC